MKTFGDNARTKTKYVSRMGAFCILLAVTLTACESPDSREVDTDAQQGMTDADGGARMMKVSITSSGDIVPTVQSGRTTFTVENTHAEDCQLTLTPQDGSDISGRNTMGEGAMGEDGLGDEASPGTAPGMTQRGDDRAGTGAGAGQNPDAGAQNGTDPARTPQTDAGRAGATQGETTPRGTMQGQNNRVTAGQATTVTVNLEPGLYEVSCRGVGSTDQQGTVRQGANPQGTNQLGAMGDTSPMLVMVTEETSLGGATQDARDAAQPGSIERPEADNLGTENE